MELDIHPLAEGDLAAADRIFRLAFGTFLGLPEPSQFGGDADFVGTRWRAAPTASLGAYHKGELIGSNFAAVWGSFGFFGPLTVHPAYWGQGVARRLLDRTMPLFEESSARHTALFTFPQSVKHVALYQKYGYWSQQLTMLMARSAQRREDASWSALSEAADRSEALAACRTLADAVYPGLDLTPEIESVAAQRLGDTILVREGDDLAAFAVCHVGKGTEAGSDTAYVKFAAARPGADAPRRFGRLLAACEDFAARRGAGKLLAGVNAARSPAYRQMLAYGFTTMLQGVAMQRDHAPGFNRPDAFVLDDWR